MKGTIRAARSTFLLAGRLLSRQFWTAFGVGKTSFLVPKINSPDCAQRELFLPQNGKITQKLSSHEKFFIWFNIL